MDARAKSPPIFRVVKAVSLLLLAVGVLIPLAFIGDPAGAKGYAEQKLIGRVALALSWLIGSSAIMVAIGLVDQIRSLPRRIQAAIGFAVTAAAAACLYAIAFRIISAKLFLVPLMMLYVGGGLILTSFRNIERSH